jgi:hypothetical protein
MSICATSTEYDYDLGDLVRCSTEAENGDAGFTDTDGEPMDPDAVFFKAKDPEGTVIGPYEYGTDAELVKDGPGLYHVDVDANKPGTWRYRFYSTGTGQAAKEGSFTVAPSTV